jgi:endonuclease III
MFCGAAPRMPLESNSLRVLTRIGYGREHLRNYGRTYKSVQDAIALEIPQTPEKLMEAHLLLRQHGKVVCRNNGPLCHECSVSADCQYLAKMQRTFLGPDSRSKSA